MKDLGAQGLAKERVEKDKSMFGGKELKGKTLAVIGLGHIGASTARDAASLGMNIAGYDPGLSIDSALKLPRSIKLADSIAGVVAGADYISINIPYIKGEGGTHGIIGKDVINHCKSDAVFLNFARGELVDSKALKEFLDKGDGKYISDFPDDDLWDHKNAVILPHLGASTAEAEDEAAGMAADTIRDYLETGTIRNSVNFPSTALPHRPTGSIRITVVNRNEPGMLAQITEIFGKYSLNITQQINQSRNMIAYNVIDLDHELDNDAMEKLQEELTTMDGVLSSRILGDTFGAGYARNVDGKYYV
jgi:D-3-phosphoglycerate dehydrogenase